MIEKSLKELQSPILSIVVPVHNGEAHIQQCVDSLLAQSQDQFYEIIILENASTDQTRKKLNCYLGEPRIRVILSDDYRDLISNWCRAIKLARGEFLLVVAADDYIDANFLGNFFVALKTNPHADVFYNYYHAEVHDGNISNHRVLKLADKRNKIIMDILSKKKINLLISSVAKTEIWIRSFPSESPAINRGSMIDRIFVWAVLETADFRAVGFNGTYFKRRFGNSLCEKGSLVILLLKAIRTVGSSISTMRKVSKQSRVINRYRRFYMLILWSFFVVRVQGKLVARKVFRD